jgi:ABC-type lipoprotein export system ATPase subunit
LIVRILWLDEPLEHLDPRNRRIASLLVKASEESQTRQIVATTYEEAVARRLDEAAAARLL